MRLVGLCLRAVALLLIEIGEQRTPRSRIFWLVVELLFSSCMYYIASHYFRITINIYSYVAWMLMWFLCGKIIKSFRDRRAK